MFFNRYLCRLCYGLDQAWYINRFAEGDLPEYCRRSNFTDPDRLLDKASIEEFRRVKNLYPFKYRLDKQKFIVYANTEDELKKFNDSLAVQHHMRVEAVSLPNAADVAQLTAGEIVTPDSQYAGRLKVYIRDGKYEVDLLATIVDWLEKCAVVDLPEGTKKMLLTRGQYTNRYIYGCYFYITDESAITMLSLMHPKFVRKWHKISVV